MSRPEEDFLADLRATFRTEAAEHMQTITDGLLALEKRPPHGDERALVATVFRAAHSVKGASRAVDLVGVESLCQSLEDQFASWKRCQGDLTVAAFDSAHHALDAITAALSGMLSGDAESPVAPALAPERQKLAPGIPSTDAIHGPGLNVAPDLHESAREAASSPQPPNQSVRIPVEKLDAQLAAAAELLWVKQSLERRVSDLRDFRGPLEAWKCDLASAETAVHARATGVSPDGRREGVGPIDLLDFLAGEREHLRTVEGRMGALTRGAEKDRFAIGKKVDELLEGSKRLLLTPVADLAASFPKLVRDLCHELGKEADWSLRGGEIEVDKRILEGMKDPLIHLLRNSVDHGLETTARRAQSGKAPRGGIALSVSHQNGNQVEFILSDDGGGVDLEAVKRAAIKQGFLRLGDADALPDQDALNLIFRAELTTNLAVNRLSGRGLGLAIVKERAEKMGGYVQVESRTGEGTRFRVVLPLLLATFRGVQVEAGGRDFIIPTGEVERAVRYSPGDVETLEGRASIALGGRAIALVRLEHVLGLASAALPLMAGAKIPALILGKGEGRIAFSVEGVLSEQEVLVKPLRKPLMRLRNIAGAALLGSGRLAPILNVEELLSSARERGDEVPGGAPQAAAPATKAIQSILVVDDSITSRMLLKGILESAGYRVKTAVDGLDAFARLRSEMFSLVVSDVEMPRLDGFHLCMRIRADPKRSGLPIILVTALENREDRERGMEVGANAYLVKSGFDQGKLLDAVRRLM